METCAGMMPQAAESVMHIIKPKKTLAQETYEVLLNAICSGELAPGERLMQDEIASRLNVSRQPVNSAISILKTNRLVEDTGRRGVIVAPIDHGLLASIFEYRLAIEPCVVRLAAARHGTAARAEAEAALQTGRDALASGELSQLVDTDLQFHEMLYRWSGNEIIIASMQVNWHHIRRGMTEILRSPGLPEKSWQDHERIVSSIFAEDIAAAESIMTDHVEAASRIIVIDQRGFRS